MTPAEVKGAIAYFEAIFGTSVDEAFHDLWGQKLEDLKLSAVCEAIDQLAMERDYPPNVMQIRARVLSWRVPLAAEAWTKVLEEANRVGRDGKPEFANAAAARAVRAIGWRAICNSDTTTTWMFDRFVRVYESFAREERLEANAATKELEPKVLALVDGIGKDEDE